MHTLFSGVFILLAIIGSAPWLNASASLEPLKATQATAASPSQTLSSEANRYQRIVLLDFGAFDTLVKWDLADKVIALPKNIIPDYLQTAAMAVPNTVGGLKAPNIEKITQLAPDLIIINRRQQTLINQLAKIAPVINLHHPDRATEHYLADTYSNLNQLATLFHRQDKLAQQISALNQSITQLQQTVQSVDQHALILLHNKGDLIALPSHPVITEIANIKTAKLPAKPDERRLHTRDIAKINPDSIFIIDRSQAIGNGALNRQQFFDQYIHMTKAYQSQQIHFLDPTLWYLSGGGLTSLNLQLAELTRALH